MAKKLKCAECGEIILEENESFDTIDGKVFCEGCYNADFEYPSTVICFSPDGTNETSQFTKNFGDEDGEVPIPIKSQKWVSTDAWRGYTDWDLLEGYVEVADGWITGYPDETVRRKIELNDIFEDLKKGKIKPPCMIYWIFGITSNVFSTASTIAIEKGNEKLIEKWLKEIDGGIEGLKDMLG